MRMTLSKRWSLGGKTNGETFDGLAALQAKLDNMDHNINKMKQIIHAMQVGCENYKDPHYQNLHMWFNYGFQILYYFIHSWAH